MLKPPDARKDFLTNCYVRDGLQPFLSLLEERFAVAKKPFSVLMTDVDHFKHFNDKFGHLNGDEVLKYFSSSLRLDLEDEENAPFRFGGDEFVIVFPDKNAAEAAKLAARLKKNIKTRSCLIRGRQLTITFSGGIACYPTDARSLEQLLERADQALYYSKNHGRAQVTCYGEVKYKSAIKLLFIAAVVILGLSALNLVSVDFLAPVKMAREALTSLLPSKVNKPADTPVQPDGSPETPGIGSPAVPPPHTEPEKGKFSPSDFISSLTKSAPTPQPPPPVEPVTPEPVAQPAPEEKRVRLHLKNNRTLEGRIVSEDDDSVAIEIGFQEGKAMMRFRRSQIEKIEKV